MDEVVKYANAFLEAAHKLETVEKKILIGLSHKAQKAKRSYNSDGDLMFEVSGKTICDMVGIAYHPKTIRSAIQKLQERVIQIVEGEEEWTSFQVLGKSDYKNGTLNVRMYKEILPYLINLNDKWTAYKLINISKLKSQFSIRLYELLKARENFRERRIFLDDLRAMLDCVDKFVQYGEFKKNVIEKARLELDQKCDICFEYREEKLGHKVHCLEFKIFRNPNVQIEEVKEFDSPYLPGMREEDVIDVELNKEWDRIVTYLKVDLGVVKDPDTMIREAKKGKMLNRNDAKRAVIDFVEGPLGELVKKGKMEPKNIVNQIESRAVEWYLAEDSRMQKEKLLLEQKIGMERAEAKRKAEEEEKNTARYKAFLDLSEDMKQNVLDKAKEFHEGTEFFPRLNEITENSLMTWVPWDVFNLDPPPSPANDGRYELFMRLPEMVRGIYYDTAKIIFEKDSQNAVKRFPAIEELDKKSFDELVPVALFKNDESILKAYSSHYQS